MFGLNLNDTQTNEEKEGIVLSKVEEMVGKAEYAHVLELFTNLQDEWKDLTTARLTKMLKKMFKNLTIELETYEGILILLNGLINWCGDKKLLKCDLECKLIYVYMVVGMHKECLELIKKVSSDLKQFDDKVNLIRVFIYESRVYYELRNLNMAKSVLTAAKAKAVTVACPSELQAQIDMLNGMFLMDDGCYDSAMGYFVESIEGFCMDKLYSSGRVPLKYLILSKILAKKFNEINGILSNKFVIKINNETESDEIYNALLEIVNIAKNRDVVMYKNLLVGHNKAFEHDKFVYKHLNFYYNRLLDQNILKIIEPYSNVKIAFIANKLNFDERLVEDKLRMMILDKTIYGILDHRTECLVLFDQIEEDETEFEKNIKTLTKYLSKIK